MNGKIFHRVALVGTILFTSCALLVGAAGCRGGGEMPPGVPQPPKRRDPDDARRIRALEAEVAALRDELQSGPRQPYRIINAHEHLRSLGDLDKYLPAARKAGIVKTVVVASPLFTLNGRGEKGEPGMSKNFETLLQAAKAHPDEIVPFFTIDPSDPDKLERAKKHLAAGGKGVKIYSGHSNFYGASLDDASMEPVYAWLEEEGIPINWHINLSKFFDEFERVMKKHPRLNVMVPHYGVLFWRVLPENMQRVDRMMTEYPHFYLDTSLGTRQILIDGFAAMDRDREVWTDLVKKHPDRFVFGTDSVITGNREKTTTWFWKVIQSTRDQLEKESFTTELAAAYSRYAGKDMDPDGAFEGLALPPEILKKIYEENAQRWLAGTKAK